MWCGFAWLYLPMIGDALLLRKIGEKLYETPTFMAQMADDLGVVDRTVRRWANGDTAVPDTIWKELAWRLLKRPTATTEGGG